MSGIRRTGTEIWRMERSGGETTGPCCGKGSRRSWGAGEGGVISAKKSFAIVRRARLLWYSNARHLSRVSLGIMRVSGKDYDAGILLETTIPLDNIAEYIGGKQFDGKRLERVRKLCKIEAGEKF